MNVRIDVADRKEAKQIRRGLADPKVRAFVKVMGELSQLPTDQTRIRVLRFVDEHFAELEGRPPVIDWWAVQERGLPR